MKNSYVRNETKNSLIVSVHHYYMIKKEMKLLVKSSKEKTGYSLKITKG